MYIDKTILSIILLYSLCFSVIGKRDKRNIFDEEASTQVSVREMDPREMESSEMQKNDLLNQNSLYTWTLKFSKSLVLFENIVVAAYKVANYTNVANDKNAAFWQKLIPILVKILKDDVSAHSLIVKSISSLRDLSIVIENAGEIVYQSKGSAKSIEIAREDIPQALYKLTNYSALLSKIEMSAIETFANQTEEIFNIIGPEAANFAKQRAEIEKELNDLYDSQQKLYILIATKQGELAGLNYLINATQKQLYGAQQALNESKQRTDALTKINLAVENTITAIPISTTQAVTTTTHYRSGFLFFWGSDKTTSETKNVVVPNPDRDAEVKYYENIVKSRMERIKENEATTNSTNEIIKELNESLGDLITKYNQTEAMLKQISVDLGSKLKYNQDRLNNLTNKLIEINKNEKNITDTVGVGGQGLIECLASVRQISETVHEGQSGYATLASILEGINSMVKIDVKLLDSSDINDIFLADVRLMKKVGFLANYTIIAQQYLLSSKEYNSVATKIQKF